MASIEEIKKYFLDVNIDPTAPVLDKCLELCINYHIGPEDFVDEWFAYTTSNLNGALPTVEELEKMERKEFQKQTKDVANVKKSMPANKTSNIQEDIDTTALVNSYSGGTPKSNKTLKSIQTPENPRRAGTSLNFDTTTDIYGSPAQTITQSENYSKRKNSGSVSCSYGPATATFERTNNSSLHIKINGEEDKSCMTAEVKYMFEVMGRKARSINAMTEWLGEFMIKKHNLTVSEGKLKNFTGQMKTYGRIIPDSDGKINAQSILLEGTQQLNMAHTVTLNINKVQKYALFPGQVAVVEGSNAHNGTFYADKILTDAAPNLPVDPPNISDAPLQLVIASGPFTLPSNFSYEPLNDILKYVVEKQPNVLILMGPFIEETHEGINNGQLTETFDSLFEKIVDNVMTTLQEVDVEVVIMSSGKDAHHHPVYPTPAYKITKEYPKLTMVSDPCMVNINGLIIGGTTPDVLFDISNNELYQDKTLSAPADRLARLASHLLNQQSFYPLYPANPEMNIDHELLEQYGIFECIPHILILPSMLRHFVKNISGCLVINPEKATKGYGAGTFARLEITPGSSTSICNRSSCQILRV